MPIVIAVVIFVVVVILFIVGSAIVGSVGGTGGDSDSRCRSCREMDAKWNSLTWFEKILAALAYGLQKLLCIGC
jgi:hypothetical protein